MYANTLDRVAALFLWKFSILERAETRALAQAVREGMIVVDVGANLGYYALQFARAVGTDGKVFAFEPDPDNYSLLVKNVRANGYRNVICINKAVSSVTGHARLYLSEEHRGDHRIFDSHDGRSSIEIEATALDEFLLEEERVDVVKMDIQGAEFLAILGMERTIQKNPHLVIVCEFAPELLANAGFSAGELIDKIADLGFALQYIDENRGCILPISKTDLVEMCSGQMYVSLYLANRSTVRAAPPAQTL